MKLLKLIQSIFHFRFDVFFCFLEIVNRMKTFVSSTLEHKRTSGLEVLTYILHSKITMKKIHRTKYNLKSFCFNLDFLSRKYKTNEIHLSWATSELSDLKLWSITSAVLHKKVNII